MNEDHDNESGSDKGAGQRTKNKKDALKKNLLSEDENDKKKGSQNKVKNSPLKSQKNDNSPPKKKT
jgi:hypothetical protein